MELHDIRPLLRLLSLCTMLLRCSHGCVSFVSLFPGIHCLKVTQLIFPLMEEQLFPVLAAKLNSKIGSSGSCIFPARERPSMSAATSMVEARCIARALAPWRGLCSLAVMMSLVMMCFLLLGQTTPDDPGSAVTKP